MNTNIIVALFSEAKPLIEKLGLKESQKHSPFRLFKSASTTLIIGGMGKTAIASACGYLHALNQGTSVWVNVGIAGHRSESIGELFIANKILDLSNGQVWYPPQIISTAVTTYELHTVDAAEYAYPEDVGYDMEGAAFYASACRFNTSELVQCLKVVSDNATSCADRINKNTVEALIRHRADDIISAIKQFSVLAETLPKPVELNIDGYLDQWHFSHAQQLQLRSLLVRLAVIGTTPAQPSDLADSRAVIQHLQNELLHSPVHFA